MGVLIPTGAAVQDYSASILFGGYYLGCMERMPFEIGVDLAWIDSKDGSVEAMLYPIRFDCLFSFSKWNAFHPQPDVYGVVGLQAIPDSAASAGGGSESEVAGGLNLGVGLLWPKTGWDARLTYSMMMGSDNIKGLLMITGAFDF